jgi:hypothetical protein
MYKIEYETARSFDSNVLVYTGEHIVLHLVNQRSPAEDIYNHFLRLILFKIYGECKLFLKWSSTSCVISIKNMDDDICISCF